MWAIKTPNGKLITHSVAEDKTTCYEGYVNNLLNRGHIKERKEWIGDQVYVKHWRTLREAGYSIVHVIVDTTACRGWKIPHLIERR